MSNTYSIIGAFNYMADAELLRTRLEAEGIPVTFKDANIMQAEPFIGPAVGGVKVMVPKEYQEQAEAIYNAVRPYARDKAGNLLVCPNCKASRMERHYKPTSLLHRLFPFLESPKFKCQQCGIITRLEA